MSSHDPFELRADGWNVVVAPALAYGNGRLYLAFAGNDDHPGNSDSQIAEAMKANKISRSGLATKMKTSRSEIGRLLDPKDDNVTLATLQRAARMVGRSLRLKLV